MYGLTGPSVAQRLTLAAALAISVAVVWWLLFAGGVAIVGVWLGHPWGPGEPARRAALAIALTLCAVRAFLTGFVFLKRGVSWSEALMVAPWVFALYAFLALAGGTNPIAFGLTGIDGAALVLLGVWIGAYAEHQRHAFKQCPGNRGKLYTRGLFRLTRHPNYFGDLIAFSGICLIACRWFTAIVPALMFCGFVFANVPALDAHLAARYGPAFDEYARKTRKLIPFIY